MFNPNKFRRYLVPITMLVLALVAGSAYAATTIGTNISTGGTLAVTGASTLTGALYANGGLDRSTAAALAIGATNATSVAITPNTTIAGTLGVTGASTLAGAVTIGGGYGSTGLSVATDGNVQTNGTLTVDGTINKLTLTAPATGATLTIADGKTLTASNTLTLAGTDATTMTFPASSTTVAGLGIAQTFSANQTIGAGIKLVLDSGTASATTGAATLSKQAGIVTSEALTTVAGATYTLTLTNTLITASSNIIAQATLGTATTGTPLVTKITPGSGSATIVVTNIHASAALNGTILIGFTLLN